MLRPYIVAIDAAIARAARAIDAAVALPPAIGAVTMPNIRTDHRLQPTDDG